MNKHYVFSHNPEAKHDWDRYTLRNPISGERPDLQSLIAEALGEEAGSYLVSLKIEVEVLEKAALEQAEPIPVEIPTVLTPAQRQELVA